MTLPVLKTLGARHSAGLFISPILGDGMMPTYREGWDFVVVQPCRRYEGEWIYMLDHGMSGILQAYRASVRGRSGIRLFRDNAAYRDDEITTTQFEAIVIGRVVGDIKARDRGPFLDALRELLP